MNGYFSSWRPLAASVKAVPGRNGGLVRDPELSGVVFVLHCSTARTRCARIEGLLTLTLAMESTEDVSELRSEVRGPTCAAGKARAVPTLPKAHQCQQTLHLRLGPSLKRCLA
jgi:hypothetical protein